MKIVIIRNEYVSKQSGSAHGHFRAAQYWKRLTL